ncbi:MAG: tRNA (guanosine(37)-N1)-methyltransferase TrmD [Gemmatimonadales bacterium]|nr:tRNA (guanosine(37)-N1)-methyltransferase TrmD [Gemmatimonadales bacterium]
MSEAEAPPRTRINVISLFPEVMAPYLAASIPARAVEKGLVEFRLVQLRDYATDRHRTVDDTPYGGGAGMVIKPDVVFAAVESLGNPGRVLVMSARGVPLTHRAVVRYSLAPVLTLIAGHYKDLDQRIVDGLNAEEVCVGDFILSGGEPAALCLIDAVVRLLPGALGDHESASSDSFYDGLLSPPSYTRPPEFRGMAVPAVLRSGNHAEIAAWKQQEAERLTSVRRPDLWAAWKREHDTET